MSGMDEDRRDELPDLSGFPPVLLALASRYDLEGCPVSMEKRHALLRLKLAQNEAELEVLVGSIWLHTGRGGRQSEMRGLFRMLYMTQVGTKALI
jgi:hypothetical protein